MRLSHGEDRRGRLIFSCQYCCSTTAIFGGTGCYCSLVLYGEGSRNGGILQQQQIERLILKEEQVCWKYRYHAETPGGAVSVVIIRNVRLPDDYLYPGIYGIRQRTFIFMAVCRYFAIHISEVYPKFLRAGDYPALSRWSW